jgi:subtilase-type serine protease
MKRFNASLLASTALCIAIGFGTALPAAAAPLVVSATAPGATLAPSSALTVDLLTVGDAAGESGTLTIAPGIVVTAGDGAIIGNQTGSTGTVTVMGAGAGFVVDDYLKVGNLGTGSLTFESGATGTVTGAVYVGDYDNLETPTQGGIGHLSVDGAGTNVVVELIDVRSYGDKSSTVRVTNGAHLTTQLNFYGRGDSDIYINGAGTVLKVGARDEDEVTWGNADGWFSPDGGHIELSGGAVLDADGSYIGGSQPTTMLVTGAGTRWVNGLPLYIGGTGNGDPGNGTVVVSDGAYVRAATSAVGVDTGAVGKLTITGPGTIYEVLPNTSAGSPGNFRAGFNGNGTVTVANGALLKAANQINIATNNGSVGVLNIGAAEGDAAAAAGNLDGGTLGIAFGDGDATLVFNHTDTNYVLDQTLSGTGATIKHLAGVTGLTADSADLEGDAVVSGGELYANADLSGLGVTVNANALLGGDGSVGAVTVENGGTLSPGDVAGIGTLQVNGDLTLQSGSRLKMQLVGSGYDKLELGSQAIATIADGALLDLTLLPGLDPTATYSIITVGQGSLVDEEGDGFVVNDHASLVDTLVAYNITSGVDVTFAAVTDDWSDFVGTENQKAAAAAVQALGLGNDVFDSAMFFSDEMIAESFDLLSGEIHASTETALLNDSRWLRSAAFGRLDNLTAPADDNAVLGYAQAPDAAPFPDFAPEAALSAGWISSFGAIAQTDGNGNAADTTTRSGGVIGGVDTQLDGWRVGLVGGYGHDAVEADDRLSSADVDTLYFGAYAGKDIGGWSVKTGAGLGLSQVASERQVLLDTLSADYGAWTGQVFGELGYALDIGGTTIEPFGQLALVVLNREAYTETGGVAALSSGADSSAYGLVTLGVRTANLLQDNGGRTSLKGEIGWQHAFGDLDGSVSQSFAGGETFTVAGAPIAADALALQLALEQAVGATTTVGLVYDGAIGDGQSRHSLSGRLEAKF